MDEDAKALATQTLMLLHHARSALDRAAEAKGTDEVQEHIKEAQRHLIVLLEVAQKATVEHGTGARRALTALKKKTPAESRPLVHWVSGLTLWREGTKRISAS